MSPFDTTGQKRTNWQPKRHFSQHARTVCCDVSKLKKEEPQTFWSKIKNIFKVTE